MLHGQVIRAQQWQHGPLGGVLTSATAAKIRSWNHAVKNIFPAWEPKMLFFSLKQHKLCDFKR